MLHSALPPAEDLKLVTLADIARGGMGMVQLCRVAGGRLDGRPLAVKRLNPAIEQEPEFVNMFLDETWITSTIASPHVVKVEAWGRDEQGLFLAVELVQGVSLSRLMKESKEKKEPFAERTVATIASQICAGLTAAHELRGENGSTLGLVHRDLTPGNVLCGFDGMVKIADFGIAKAEERLTSTRIGMMKGKPAYMAPEQARGGTIDARADLFALGVVMFELLADKRPWSGSNDLEILVNVSTKPHPDLSEVRRVSPVFIDIVERCLSKNPEERFGSAREVLQLLQNWMTERGFASDAQSSLSAFVQRNTPQQMGWFNQALSGELTKGGVTFMDLEAKIDQKRRGPTATSGVHKPTAAPRLPEPSAAALNHGRELEEIDDNAQTRFMPQQNASPVAPGVPIPKVAGLSGTLAMNEVDAHRVLALARAPQGGQTVQTPVPTVAINQMNPNMGAGSAHFLAATDSMDAPFSSLPPTPVQHHQPHQLQQPIGYPVIPAPPTSAPQGRDGTRTVVISILVALVLAGVSFAVVYFLLSPRPT